MEGEVTPNQSLANGPTGCWRQSLTPLHEIIAWRLHGVKQLPLFARAMTSPCVGLVCHGILGGILDPCGVSNLTNLSSADFGETLMLIS